MGSSPSKADHDGLCPNCGASGAGGAPCTEKVCLRRGYHAIPAKYAERQLGRDTRLMDPLIGSVVADYVVVDTVGVGGFGRVYLALQLPIRRRPLKVALKLIDFGDNASESTIALMLQKFEAEADALASLTHPNIVRLVKYGQHKSFPYIVMEYVGSGRTLHAEIMRRVRDDRGILLDEALHIIRQVVNGIQEAHDQDIIHRDLKPDNIMLQEVAGDANFVRVLDFGLAKFVDERSDTSVAIGTPMYMAPEQLDKSNIGPWTDVYALGVMTFELFTGRRAFEGEYQDIYRQKLDHSYDPARRIGDLNLPGPMIDFFRCAMATNPDERYQSCSQFRAALDKAATAQHQFGFQTIPLLMLVDIELRPASGIERPGPDAATDTHEHDGLGRMNTVQATPSGVAAGAGTQPVVGVGERLPGAPKTPASPDTMRPGHVEAPREPGRAAAPPDKSPASDHAYPDVQGPRGVVRGLSLAFVLLAIALLGAVHFMSKSASALTSFQVYSGPAARAGQPTILRMTAHSSDGRRDLPVHLESLTIDGESAQYELVGDDPTYVKLVVPNDAGSSVAVAMSAQCDGITKELSAELRVHGPGPPRDRPPLNEEVERMLQAGAEQHLTLLPQSQVLVRGMTNVLYVRARDSSGAPIADAEVTIRNKILYGRDPLTKTTDPNGLVSFNMLDVGRPGYTFRVLATKGVAKMELEQQLFTNPRQMQLSIEPPVTPPAKQPHLTLHTWKEQTHAYCELMQGDVVVWAQYVRTRKHAATIRPGWLAAGRYDMQCYDHPASPGTAYATTPVIVADGSPLAAVVEEVKRHQLPGSASVDPSEETDDPKVAIGYWLAVLRHELTQPKLVLDTRKEDIAAFNDTRKVRQTRVLSALGVVGLLFLLWLADGVLKTVIATRQRLREFDDSDAPAPIRLIRLRGALLILVLLGAIAASALGVVWLVANVA